MTNKLILAMKNNSLRIGTMFITYAILFGCTSTIKTHPDFETRIDNKEVRGRVNWHLTKLKRKHAEVLVLHHVLGYTMTEVASLTNVKLEASRARLKKARKKVRDHIQLDSVLVRWADQGEGS